MTLVGLSQEPNGVTCLCCATLIMSPSCGHAVSANDSATQSVVFYSVNGQNVSSR